MQTPEEIREYQRVYREKNREKLRAYHRDPLQVAKSYARKKLRQQQTVETPEKRAARLAYHAEYRKKNREKLAAWREANRESTRLKRQAPDKKQAAKEWALAWRKANPEKVRAKWKRAYYKNRDKMAARMTRWQRENPEIVSFHNRRRKALRRGRIHPEHDREIERGISAECRRLTRETGIQHHVDHIIPLIVGGWHHHENLQILPGWINSQKKNSPLWEVEGYKSWRDVPRFLWPERLVPRYSNLLYV